MRKQIKALWEPFIEILDSPTVLPLPFWCSSCLHFYALVTFTKSDEVTNIVACFDRTQWAKPWKILAAGGFNSPILQQLLLFTLCEHAQAKVAQYQMSIGCTVHRLSGASEKIIDDGHRQILADLQCKVCKGLVRNPGRALDGLHSESYQI